MNEYSGDLGKEDKILSDLLNSKLYKDSKYSEIIFAS